MVLWFTLSGFKNFIIEYNSSNYDINVQNNLTSDFHNGYYIQNETQQVNLDSVRLTSANQFIFADDFMLFFDILFTYYRPTMIIHIIRQIFNILQAIQFQNIPKIISIFNQFVALSIYLMFDIELEISSNLNKLLDNRLIKVIQDLKNPVQATGQIINDPDMEPKDAIDLANQELEDMADMLENLQVEFKLRHQMDLREKQREAVAQEFFEGIQRTHIRTANNEHNNLVINMKENIPKVLKIQKINLKRIINNLISQSLKHTSDSEVVVTIEHESISNEDQKNNSVLNAGWYVQGAFQPAEFLVIEVKGSGGGIPGIFLPKLFEQNEFTKIDLDWEGNEIGLSICSVLCRKQAAFIKQKSELKVGSVFRLQVPHEKARVNIGRRISMQSEVSDITNHQSHQCNSIIFVEDNTNIMSKQTKFATKNDLLQNSFQNGRSALNFVKNNQCLQCNKILVMTDLKMPQLDGVELAKKLRASEDSMKVKFVIILVSAEEYHNDDNLFNEVYYKPLPIRKIRDFCIKYVN